MGSRRLPVLLVGLAAAASASAAVPTMLRDPGETRTALARALAEQRVAAARAARLEAQAARASAAAERTARTAAAVAARIQQAEAGIAAGEARIALIERRREALRARLAARQQPVVRLTGALQLMARRPLLLAVLRPGSLDDVVHTRAVLETMLPLVRARTAGLRAELARARELQRQARAVQAALRADQGKLAERRRALAALESRQRLESRAVQGSASREQDRALALAEEARDLGALVGELAAAGALRRELAALPGPVLRPARPEQAQVGAERVTGERPAELAYILPVAGALVTGFGEQSSGGGPRSRGITLAPRAGAQVVAPAAGRVAFAGPYAGYGRIVILEHPGGWTTLVTDLATVGPAVGDELVQGAPLGRAGPGRPTVTVELRKDGAPVDILAAARGA